MEDLGIEPDGSYMETHPLKTCAWCKLPEGSIESDEQRAAAIAATRTRSIPPNRWHWQPGPEYGGPSYGVYRRKYSRLPPPHS